MFVACAVLMGTEVFPPIKRNGMNTVAVSEPSLNIWHGLSCHNMEFHLKQKFTANLEALSWIMHPRNSKEAKVFLAIFLRVVLYPGTTENSKACCQTVS